MRLLIIQDYVPAYREPLFVGLRERLAPMGIELCIAAGQPRGNLAARHDSARATTVDFPLRQSQFSLGPWTLNMKHVHEIITSYRPDGVVVEQALKHLELYPLLMRGKFLHSPRFAFWGQGRTFSTRQSPPVARLKDWVTKQSDWFFSYTQSGADHLVEHGYAPNRITVLNNTIDVNALLSSLGSLRQAEIDEFRQRHGLRPGLTGLFMGGVDSAKGIDWLLTAAQQIQRQVPEFRLVVAGAGESAATVEESQRSGGPIVYLGRVDGEQKALALAASDLMLIPKWVGLVAVDSLVSGRPIVTTASSTHSPEFDYLESGRNALVTEQDLGSFVAGVVHLLQDPAQLAALSTQARIDSASLSLESMIMRFSQGLAAWLVLD